MKIAMLGHKAVPSTNGGIETVLTDLCPLLADAGHSVVCYNRKTDVEKNAPKTYKGVTLKKAFTIKKRGVSAMLASFTAAIAVAFKRYDVVHFHAEGPCAALWIPKLFRKKCVATVHGLDWQRAKWQHGFGAKYIKFGEKVMAKYADKIIVLSKPAQQYFKQAYNRDTVLIPNGIGQKQKRSANEITQKFGLHENQYIFTVSRLTAEKGLHYLIEAYQQLQTDKKLVICGDAEGSEDYGQRLKEMAKDNPNIIFTGFIAGTLLEEMFSNGYLYCLPSDLEGMSISLLEGMAFGNAVLCSDIPENTDVCENHAIYFEKGNVESLKNVLKDLLENESLVKQYKNEAADFICTKYSWRKTAEMTCALYHKTKTKRCRT